MEVDSTAAFLREVCYDMVTANAMVLLFLHFVCLIIGALIGVAICDGQTMNKARFYQWYNRVQYPIPHRQLNKLKSYNQLRALQIQTIHIRYARYLLSILSILSGKRPSPLHSLWRRSLAAQSTTTFDSFPSSEGKLKMTSLPDSG